MARSRQNNSNKLASSRPSRSILLLPDSNLVPLTTSLSVRTSDRPANRLQTQWSVRSGSGRPSTTRRPAWRRLTPRRRSGSPRIGVRRFQQALLPAPRPRQRRTQCPKADRMFRRGRSRRAARQSPSTPAHSSRAATRTSRLPGAGHPTRPPWTTSPARPTSTRRRAPWRQSPRPGSWTRPLAPPLPLQRSQVEDHSRARAELLPPRRLRRRL